MTFNNDDDGHTHVCLYPACKLSGALRRRGKQGKFFFAPTGLLASYPSDCTIFLNQSEVKDTEIVKKTIDIVKSHQLLL